MSRRALLSTPSMRAAPLRIPSSVPALRGEWRGTDTIFPEECFSIMWDPVVWWMENLRRWWGCGSPSVSNDRREGWGEDRRGRRGAPQTVGWCCTYQTYLRESAKGCLSDVYDVAQEFLLTVSLGIQKVLCTRDGTSREADVLRQNEEINARRGLHLVTHKNTKAND